MAGNLLNGLLPIDRASALPQIYTLPMKKQIKFLATATALLTFTQAAQAELINWVGGGADTEWSTAANWENCIPTPNQNSFLFI